MKDLQGLDLKKLEIQVKNPKKTEIQARIYHTTKDEISYPNSFIMVRLTRPSNFKFPGLFHSQFFPEKTWAV